MSFGLHWKNGDGNLSISSEEKSLEYIGAPTLKSTFDPASVNGLYYEELYNGTNRTTDSGVAGVDRVAVWSWTWGAWQCTNPSGLYWENGYSDDVRVFEYLIYSRVKPLIFIYCASGYTGVVIGIVATGDTDPVTGYPEWSIKIAGAAALGAGDYIVNNIDIYCFDQITDTENTYGIQVFDGSSNLMFMNTDHPLVVKDILEITNLTTALVLTCDTLVNDIGDLDNLSKPAFLALDFAHFEGVVSSATYKRVAYYWYGGYPPAEHCDDYRTYYPKFTYSGIFGGLKWNAVSQEIDAAGITLKTTDLDAVVGAPTTGITTIYESFPAYIPIIDGADYD